MCTCKAYTHDHVVNNPVAGNVELTNTPLAFIGTLLASKGYEYPVVPPYCSQNLCICHRCSCQRLHDF